MRLDIPVFMAVPKPFLTEFGIHQRLDSCNSFALVLFDKGPFEGLRVPFTDLPCLFYRQIAKQAGHMSPMGQHEFHGCCLKGKLDKI